MLLAVIRFRAVCHQHEKSEHSAYLSDQVACFVDSVTFLRVPRALGLELDVPVGIGWLRAHAMVIQRRSFAKLEELKSGGAHIFEGLAHRAVPSLVPKKSPRRRDNE